MVKKSLSYLIKKAQRGEKSAMEELLNRFQPLFLKYGFKFGSEDVVQELKLFFLKMIIQMKLSSLRNTDDPTLIKYIQRSLSRKQIALSKAQYRLSEREIPILDYHEHLSSKLEKLLSINDIYFESEKIFALLNEHLTQAEQKVLIHIILKDETVSTTAIQLGISRQAVNRTKLRAFKKLRKALQLIQ